MKNKILITGMTGNVGSEVVKFLQLANIDYKAAVRNIDKAIKDYGSDIEYVKFDFLNQATYKEAFDGANKLFLVRPPALADFQKQLKPTLDYAKQVGVEQIVFLSLMGIERNPIPPHYKIEKYIKSLGIPYTFLRPSFFMQNLNQAHCFDIKERNQLFIPSGKAKVSFIDTRDISEIAAKVLIEEGHDNKAYTLTGGNAIDYFQVASIFTEILGRNIVYSNPSPLHFRRTMIQRGIDKKFANVMVGLYLTTRMGMAKKVTLETEKLLGRKPRTVREYVIDYIECWK
ncbi:MAG: SDR family oxidoreductase [Bacillota bacterium]|nr:SDR family oxidoreductase [Bacillota bacterium]